MSRCFNITGISVLICAVVSAQAVPGPKATGVSALNGVVNRIIEVTCASSMTCAGRAGMSGL